MRQKMGTDNEFQVRLVKPNNLNRSREFLIGTNNEPVVQLIGKVRSDRFYEIREVFEDAIIKYRDVTVDLSKVTEIDGAGLACLVHAFQMARNIGVEFRLGDVSVNARQILKISRLDSIFLNRKESACT